jgi:lipoprotein-releasing system ATP-binding protein
MADVVLEAKGVRKRYPQGQAGFEALHGVDLQVRAGEFIAVLGPSGSGKSTLLNLLGLLDTPTEGEVVLFGQPTRALGEEARAALRSRRLGFVFQFDSLLPEFTVLENVTLPARMARKRTGEPLGKIAARARDLLGQLEVLPLADRFPVQLSGGERQRAAIARALVNDPAALLADEPTGNLDRHNGELVFNKARELSRSLGVAVVMVTHNEQASRYATRSIHLTDGLISEGAK